MTEFASPGIPMLGGYAECGCYTGIWHGVTPPPKCAAHSTGFNRCAVPPSLPVITITTTPMLPLPARISDDDVERIAQRVAELVRGSGGGA